MARIKILKPLGRTPMLSFVFVGLLALYFYGHVLARGFWSDIFWHTLLALLRSEAPDLPIPRASVLFGWMTLPVYHLFLRLRADLWFSRVLDDPGAVQRLVFNEIQRVITRYPHPDTSSLLSSLDLSELTNLALAGHLVTAVCLTAAFAVTVAVVRERLGRETSVLVVVALSIMLSVLASISLPGIHERMYVGLGSPNPWHSPSYLLVKPFAIGSVALTARLVVRPAGKALRMSLLIATLLALSVLAKVNFALAFIPGLLLYVVMTGSRAGQFLRFALLAAPAALLLGWTYLSTFGSGNGEERRIVFAPFAYWSTVSTFIPLSVLRGMAFPLGVLLFRFRHIATTDPALVLSWLSLTIALLQAALFAEAGPTFVSGNFMWGYSLSLSMVFLFSVIELVRWTRDIMSSENERHALRAIARGLSRPDGRSWAMVVTIVLLSLHVMSGVIYLARYFHGGILD